MDTNTFLKTLRENWMFVLMIISIVIGYTNLQNQASDALRIAQSNSEWQTNWESNGELPLDIIQNGKIEVLEEKVDKIEALDLDARLTAIEVNQDNIKVTLLEIKNAVVD